MKVFTRSDRYEDEEDDALVVECPKCHGSGLNPDGFDCDYCEGDGYVEV